VNIGKKVAVLTVAAGALVLGSAGGASAHGFGGFDPFGTVQTNKCYSGAGAIIAAAGAAPTGEVTIDSSCLNYTNGTAAVQSNDCGTGTGPITHIGGAAPTGNTSVTSNCTNIALGNDGYGHG